MRDGPGIFGDHGGDAERDHGGERVGAEGKGERVKEFYREEREGREGEREMGYPQITQIGRDG
jgi:hypothetical protein